MIPTQSDIEDLRKLECTVEERLDEIATSARPVSAEDLSALERIVAAAAKITYGTGNPTLLSEQLRNLISWTDHVDGSAWTARFQQVLMTRPLASPWTATGTSQETTF
jgi:hypothetical protein